MSEDQRHSQASQRAQERAAQIRARETRRAEDLRSRTTRAGNVARTNSAGRSATRAASNAQTSSSREAARARAAARKREAEYRRNASTGRRYLVLIVAAIVIALVFVAITVGSCAVRGCNGPGAQSGSQATDSPAASGASTDAPATNGSNGSNSVAGTAAPSLTPASADTDSMGLPAETPDPTKLGGALESEYATALTETAAENADAAWIINHSDQLYADGDMVAYKLLKLAAMEPKACGFVRCWPEKHSSTKKGEPLTNADAPAEGRTAPLLLQWDPRWGYLIYSSTSFAVTGCGCACMAMIADGLTGTLDYSPADMAKDAEKGGFMTEFNGTSDGFFDYEAEKLGLSCRAIGTSKSELKDALSSGQLAIINVGPGDFTTGGHYIVACGITDANRLIINDPYSTTRSEQLWEIGQVLNQANNVWVFSN